MKLIFGADHAGFGLRQVLAGWARDEGYAVEEVGASSEEPYDYPDASDAVTQKILDGEADFGVLICGSGIGVSIRANRYPGIRAALCCSPMMAALARQHNYANVLCLGARLISVAEAKAIFQEFMKTEENHAERHARRVELLDAQVR